MSKTAYIGVNNIARKVKSNYIGVNGVARKVKKAYIGDANGKARLWWQSGGVIRGVWKTATVNNGRLEETRWQAMLYWEILVQHPRIKMQHILLMA